MRGSVNKGLTQQPAPKVHPNLVRRLIRLDRDLAGLLDVLHPTHPYAEHLDPWGDERAYIYTARDAIRRVSARLKPGR